MSILRRGRSGSRMHRRALCTAMLAMAAFAVSPAGVHAESNPTYTIVAGDYLYGIASKFRVRVDDLLKLNGLELTSLILPGQVLKLPGGATEPTAVTTTTTPTTAPTVRPVDSDGLRYTIQAGDSLWGIATSHGVSLAALLAANGIEATALILPGRTLALPQGATATRLTTPTTTPTPTGTTTTTTSPATTATTLPAPAGSAPLVYTVVSGDYLSGIASRAGVRLSELLALNGLTASSMIHPGTKLLLPIGAVMPTAGAPATSTTTSTASSNAPKPAPTGNAKIDKVLAFAYAQLGKPYVFFTAGPDTYDCSGLVKAAYATIGYQLPHQSYAQSKFGTPVDWHTEEIRPGDLIFKYSSSNLTVISHVGIAISATQMIDAPNTGSFVRITKMPSDSSIVAVQRLIP